MAVGGIGGPGGTGGDGQAALAGSVELGGTGNGGNTGVITVTNSGAITTFGDGSHGMNVNAKAGPATAALAGLADLLLAASEARAALVGQRETFLPPRSQAWARTPPQPLAASVVAGAAKRIIASGSRWRRFRRIWRHRRGRHWRQHRGYQRQQWRRHHDIRRRVTRRVRECARWDGLRRRWRRRRDRLRRLRGLGGAGGGARRCCRPLAPLMPRQLAGSADLAEAAATGQPALAGSAELAAPASAAIPASLRSRPPQQASSRLMATGHTAFLLMRKAGPATAAMAALAALASAASAALAARAETSAMLRPLAFWTTPRRSEDSVGLAG